MKKNVKKDYRRRDIERIRSLRLLDDMFMKVVLQENRQGVQDIIQTVLGRKDIFVEELRTQEELSNLLGHGVRIDVLARDTKGTYYNIEIQRSDGGAIAQRARYNLSAIDWHMFEAGADYKDLPETYVIFITENDIWGGGLPVYTVERRIKETGKLFDDKGHILYVNGEYSGEDEIGRLMADFRETDPRKMQYPSLSERAGFYKNTEGGIASMCRVMEEVRREGIELGREEGREEGIELGREEGREEGIELGREEGRIVMIVALLAGNTENDLLHHARFQSLHITQDEINTARSRGEKADKGYTHER